MSIICKLLIFALQFRTKLIYSFMEKLFIILSKSKASGEVHAYHRAFKHISDAQDCLKELRSNSSKLSYYLNYVFVNE